MPESEATDRFIAALHALERDRDVETIAGLFAEESDVGNVASPRAFRGVAGAREFWESYRSWFGEVESDFRNVIVGEGRAALEWSTTGSSAAGDPIAYDGVSILELADGKITRFRAYFDPGALGQQMVSSAAPGAGRA
jgi:ketosteroid isomerase-like protein